jgi:UDP-N-acetylmuramate dehydrogenase
MSTKWPTNWFDDPGKVSDHRIATARPSAYGGVRCDVPMSEWTTFRIGGPAAVLVEPATPESAVEVVRRALEREVPLRVLGHGSNLLVSDDGVDGVVLCTDRMRRAIRNEDRYDVWAGTSLSGFVKDAAKSGLSGVEGIVGIPAQIGGAIAMNAGGNWGEIFDVVETVTLCELDTGTVKTLKRAEMQPAYRDSRLGRVIVLEATMRLHPSDPATVTSATESHLREKNAAQPVAEPSAGCIFKNPKPHAAAKLIDDLGLKGTRVGGVEVSRKHANYFVNLGGGTCRDALALIEVVRDRVRKECGVELETEVKIW